MKASIELKTPQIDRQNYFWAHKYFFRGKIGRYTRTQHPYLTTSGTRCRKSRCTHRSFRKREGSGYDGRCPKCGHQPPMSWTNRCRDVSKNSAVLMMCSRYRFYCSYSGTVAQCRISSGPVPSMFASISPSYSYVGAVHFFCIISKKVYIVFVKHFHYAIFVLFEQTHKQQVFPQASTKTKAKNMIIHAKLNVLWYRRFLAHIDSTVLICVKTDYINTAAQLASDNVTRNV